MNPELIMMVGLPRSGKSTLALTHGVPIVNPDSIRLALHGQASLPQAEPMIWTMARYMVMALFIAGHKKVILDATNTTRRRRDEWRSADWNRSVIWMKTDTQTCHGRAAASNQPYLHEVIDRMASRFEPPSEAEGFTSIILGNALTLVKGASV